MENQNPPSTPIEQSPPPSRPVILPPTQHLHLFSILLVGVIMLLLGLTGGYFLFGIKSTSPSTTTLTPMTTLTTMPIPSPKLPSGDTSTDWKVYNSTTEKISFSYPANWTETTPDIKTDNPIADQISLKSPSGDVKINWVSAIGGFGGACDKNVQLGQNGDLPGCPLLTVIDKTTITGAPGLYVVSGTTTRDGKTFEPWIAVQDKDGTITTQRSMGYDLFTGKNNGGTTAIFSTSNGAYANGPSLNQADAEAYFSKPEVKQAKLIFQSLKY